jgi:hypothetical protein
MPPSSPGPEGIRPFARASAAREGLELAARVGERLAADAGATASFLAGSLAEGLGNRTSDVDVYLTGPTLTRRRRQLSVGGIRLDAHYLPLGFLTGLVDRVLAAAPPGGPTALVADTDLALTARLRTARVLTGADVIHPLQDRVRQDSARLRRLAIASCLDLAYAEFEDFVGAQDSGDLDAATMLARGALIMAGKAVAAACDELYAGRKWVWRQLGRSAPAGFPLPEFAGLLRRDPVGDFGDLLTMTQTCLAAAATLGWQGISLDRWPRWLPGAGEYRRIRLLWPRQCEGGVLLAEPAVRRVRLSQDAALVWGLCQGVSADGLAAEVAGIQAATDGYKQLDGERCRRLGERLIAAGLVTDGGRG